MNTYAKFVHDTCLTKIHDLHQLILDASKPIASLMARDKPEHMTAIESSQLRMAAAALSGAAERWEALAKFIEDLPEDITPLDVSVDLINALGDTAVMDEDFAELLAKLKPQ